MEMWLFEIDFPFRCKKLQIGYKKLQIVIDFMGLVTSGYKVGVGWLQKITKMIDLVTNSYKIIAKLLQSYCKVIDLYGVCMGLCVVVWGCIVISCYLFVGVLLVFCWC